MDVEIWICIDSDHGITVLMRSHECCVEVFSELYRPSLVICVTRHGVMFARQIHVPGAPKKSKYYANFSRTIESYDIKFYTLVSHSIVRKCEKFHYIIYRIGKIALQLRLSS